MIFATVGTQAPFDRFIKMLDELAVNLNEDVIAQTFNGEYKPKNIKTVDFVPPDEFSKYFSKARLIVSHAGMGTILSALTKHKPIIVIPRLASLGEHRNDHQLATAMRLDELGFVNVAYDRKQLETLLLHTDLKPLREISANASQQLIDSITNFIAQRK